MLICMICVSLKTGKSHLRLNHYSIKFNLNIITFCKNSSCTEIKLQLIDYTTDLIKKWKLTSFF